MKGIYYEPMKYKALMLDVDGTLARSQERTLPTEKVCEAIHLAKDKIYIGIATGRPFFLIEDIVSHLDLSGPSVVNDGGIVMDVISKKVYYEKLIPPDVLHQIFAILLKYKIGFFIHDDTQDVPYAQNYKPYKPFSIFTVGVSEDVAEEAYQELLTLPSFHITKYISWINGLTGILINHAEATKQHGIFEVAKILKIKPEEIIGVGDGYNDFPLLMACGLKIAMGNAVPELKEIADYVAPSVENDGVAHIIQKFILEEQTLPQKS